MKVWVVQGEWLHDGYENIRGFISEEKAKKFIEECQDRTRFLDPIVSYWNDSGYKVYVSVTDNHYDRLTIETLEVE